MSRPVIDETSNRYGRLSVVKRSRIAKHGAHWLCQCDCGSTSVVAGSSLRRGLSRSCGCSRHSRTPKLTPDEVSAIRVHCAAYPEWGAQTRMARRFGVSHQAISAIVRRATYRYLKPDDLETHARQIREVLEALDEWEEQQLYELMEKSFGHIV